MTQLVTLRSPSGETRDSIGGSTPTYLTTTTYMYIEPKTGKEDMTDRNTPIGDWLGIGHRDMNFDSWKQVLYGDHVFDIVSPPRPFYNPTLGAISHVEMDLQEVT